MTPVGSARDRRPAGAKGSRELDAEYPHLYTNGGSRTIPAIAWQYEALDYSAVGGLDPRCGCKHVLHIGYFRQ